MHLDGLKIGAAGTRRAGRAVDDERTEVVVVLDLGPLAEVGDILQRQRVQLENVTQERHVVVVGLLDVEPEEDAAGEPLLDARSLNRGLHGPGLVDQVPRHGWNDMALAGRSRASDHHATASGARLERLAR